MKRLIVLLVLPLYACSTLFFGSTCTMFDYSDRTEEIWDNFGELESLATESAFDDTINLPSVVDQLQQTRNAYAALKLPSCYEAAHNSHTEYMDLSIETWSYLTGVITESCGLA